MNQELTQRIIGAIVVTALAAIFIPMLFEDPVDNSGQVVSELVIPEEPAITVDDSVSRLPRNPEDIAPLPDETIETPDNLAEMEMTPPSDQEPSAEDMADPEAPGDEGGLPDAAHPDEEPDNNGLPTTPAASLDTGEVREVKKPLKKITAPSHEAKPEPVKPQKKSKPVTPTPTPATKTATPAKIKTVKPEKTASGLSRYYLQAGSFSKKENAVTLSETLRKLGMPVLLETLQTSKGPLYRLRVGPELDKQRAAAMKSKLDQQNIKAILIAE